MDAFTRQRIAQTLGALDLSPLTLERAEQLRVAQTVASWPPMFSTRWAQAEAWPSRTCEGLEHLRSATGHGSGVIVVAAHFGAYLWTLIALLEQRIPVSLLVDRRNRGFFETDVRERMEPLFPDRDWSVFEGIDSEDPMSLWRLSKAAKAGRAVIVFVDGNSGIDGLLNPNGAVEVDFLGRPIWVRPGIAALAQSTGCPLVPVRTRYDAERDVATFTFEEPRRVDTSPRVAGRAIAMRELFAWLEAQVLAEPHLWEEWWLLPKWLRHPALPTEDQRVATSVRPTNFDAPALVGLHLGPGKPSVWAVGDAVIDAETPEEVYEGAELLSLVQAAWRGDKALAWLREQDAPSKAKAALRQAVERRWVTLARQRAE